MNKEERELMDRLLKADKPLYEKLAHNEVFLIEKEGNTIIYAVNRLGTVKLMRAVLVE